MKSVWRSMIGCGAACVLALPIAAQTPASVARQVEAQRDQAQTAPADPERVDVPAAKSWWEAGDGRRMAAVVTYANPYGRLEVLNVGGGFETKGHPFFTPLGTNGRACVTCHQPADGMSVSVASLRERWKVTRGRDPVFAAVDGANCPSLDTARRSSHSLLLDHGLFRIFLPWPIKDAEFSLEVVRDPSGCNTDPVYGLTSPNPMISVFRRPRPAANLKYVTTPDSIGFNVKTGMPLARDPVTGAPVSMQLLADARQPTLKTQGVEAAITHLQAPAAPTRDQLDAILAFENQVYAAQSVPAGSPPGLGAQALAKARPGLLGNDLKTPVFQPFDLWRARAGEKLKGEAAFRASVARGADVFLTRPFWISDTSHLNTVGLGNPIKRTCSTCHNAQMSGMDVAPGWMDIGTNNQPNADPLRRLPLFKVTCRADAPPHPFLGRTILTHDPGRALISGLCRDVGSITMQQFRGLAARAPYFANGSARDLTGLVDFYDRRYDIKFTAQEKRDLVNFMSVL